MTARPLEKNWVFVGLGNPGKKYEMTRHNMGCLVIKAFCLSHNIGLKEDKQLQCQIGKKEVAGSNLRLVLPTTYMNNSGISVRKVLNYYQLGSSDVCVVCDDAALPFGQMRLRESGSAGGHNGLKSIEQHLGTQSYARLRLGIGREVAHGKDLADYVLDKFTAEEVKLLPAFLDQAVRALEQVLCETFSNVMSVVNPAAKNLTKDK
jgi:PTH1 family peptidyl-tRNA hydrolase